MTDALKPLRDHLMKALDWSEAHLPLDRAVAAIPPDRRGERPAGLTHSAWELVEHMRLAQRDLLDFCRDVNYEHTLVWPDDYWPRTPVPAEGEWDRSLAQFHGDTEAWRALIGDSSIDLFATVPMGKAGQTHLRSILLVIDHNAHHLGQIIAVGQALTSQKPKAKSQK